MLTHTPARMASKAKFRIALVDDHPIVREGLARMIDGQADMAVCGNADNAADAVRMIPSATPDLVLLDLSLGEGDGLELAKQLHELHPDLPVLILSQHDEALYAERALRAGAIGYVMKQEPPERVMAAMRTALAGKPWVSERLSARLVQSLRGHSAAAAQSAPLERLTNRELEVFRLVGQGQTVKAIAEALFLSPKTVETHKEHIKQKLGLQSGNQLLQYAIECRGSFI